MAQSWQFLAFYSTRAKWIMAPEESGDVIVYWISVESLPLRQEEVGKPDKPHRIRDTLCHYCYMTNMLICTTSHIPSIDSQSSSPFHSKDTPTSARGVSGSYLLNSPFLEPIIHLLICSALMTIDSILPRRSRLGGYTSTRCSPSRILDCVDIRGDSLIGPVD
jgi:hypothetical protein